MDDKVLNPKTGRYFKKTSKTYKYILKGIIKKSSTSPKPDKVLNPKTGRYVKKTSKTAKDILKGIIKKSSSPKKESPKQESPKKESPKKESPKKESPKKESPKKESPKKESPKKESPKKESPKKESPKKDLTRILIAKLSKIRDYEKFNNETYKAKAYSYILAQLYNCKEPIYNYEDFERNIKVGEGIGKKVKELIETGKITYIENEVNKDDKIEVKNELEKIYGIGDVKIKALIKAGIKTIEDLKKNTHLLNKKQLLGLKYYEDLDLRIPIDEYKKHLSLIDNELKKYGKLTYDFVGSYRRGNSNMGDIDVLIMKNDKFNLRELIDELKKKDYIKEVLALGDVKFSGIVKLGENDRYRRLDILIAPEDEYYYSLLYFTGSGDFNIGFRNYIKTKYNVSLSEHGIKEGIIRIPKMSSEEEIFKFFNIKYIEPSKRKIFIMP
jgi:DNA polymerase/3'-5' exonuclease PolX